MFLLLFCSFAFKMCRLDGFLDNVTINNVTVFVTSQSFVVHSPICAISTSRVFPACLEREKTCRKGPKRCDCCRIMIGTIVIFISQSDTCLHVYFVYTIWITFLHVLKKRGRGGIKFYYKNVFSINYISCSIVLISDVL